MAQLETIKRANQLLDKIKRLDDEINLYKKYIQNGHSFNLIVQFRLTQNGSSYEPAKDVSIRVARDAHFAKSFVSENLNMLMAEKHHLQTEFDNL